MMSHNPPAFNKEGSLFNCTSVLRQLTAVTARAAPPGGTLALVGRHAAASVQARQDADGCEERGERRLV